MVYDILIIGAGPAGMNAAIYGIRAGLKVGVIEKDAPGGKMVKTQSIENYLGYQKVNGVDLSLKMFQQVSDLGVDYIYGSVKSIKKHDEIFNINTDVETLQSKTVIVATGTKERRLGIPGEDGFYGRGVSYCATCDGGLYKGKDMVVIGGGNSALQETLYLSNLASKVYLIHRRDEFRGEQYLVDKIKNTNNIEILLDTIPVAIKGEDKVKSVVLENVKTKEEKEISTEVVFPFIGFDPVTDFLDKELLDQNGYLIVDDTLQSKIEGLYGAGDVIKKSLRQIITAASDGAIAANNIAKQLLER